MEHRAGNFLTFVRQKFSVHFIFNLIERFSFWSINSPKSETGAFPETETGRGVGERLNFPGWAEAIAAGGRRGVLRRLK
jgi:hypothetical protein